MDNIKSTPKDVFLHLFNIVTFYLSVIGFITLYIQYISATFPDELTYYFAAIANGVRWSTSVLFIAVPAYLISSWLLAKDLKATPEKRELKLRKWLIYFTLFISAITIIVDLMIFVYNFLDGELTIQFFLKILVVLLVAGAVFGYYLWDLKRKETKSKIPKVLTIIVSVVVVASIIIGFFIVGTPKDQRNRKFDENRIGDLQMLQGEIVNYWTKKDALPENLSKLEDDISGFKVPRDPNKVDVYEYQIIDPLTFELCATFAKANQNTKAGLRGEVYPMSPFYDSFQQNWNHEAGRTCWSRTIDPELYKEKTSSKILID
ncbi:hypothetical protein KJ785_01235 [Patescibacteria group bacterium]|nr:hypothetical protein [Patescibacteria group bacterium]